MVSVVIPVYNCEKFICQTIDSVLRQTYRDYELILVNDGSTDHSLELLSGYQHIPNVYMINSENKGPGNARNLGMEKASGEYIIFFDADDIMEDCFLDNLVAQMKNEDCDLSIGSYEEINVRGEKIGIAKNNLPAGRYQVSDKAELAQVMNGAAFPGNKLYKLQMIRENQLRFIHTRLGEDLNFFIKYLLACKNVYCSDKIVCQYRIVRGSLSRKNDNSFLDIIKSFEELNQYMKIKNIDEGFMRCIKEVQLRHYAAQFGYYPFIEDRRQQCDVFDTFYREIKTIASDKTLQEYMPIPEIKSVFMKGKFRFIFLNPMCIWLYKKKYGWMMGKAD